MNQGYRVDRTSTDGLLREGHQIALLIHLLGKDARSAEVGQIGLANGDEQPSIKLVTVPRQMRDMEAHRRAGVIHGHKIILRSVRGLMTEYGAKWGGFRVKSSARFVTPPLERYTGG